MHSSSTPATRWAPAEWAERAILCGACGHTLSIDEYRGVTGCPACGSAFNDGCRLHALVPHRTRLEDLFVQSVENHDV